MNEKEDESLRVDICDDKYTYIITKEGKSLALRYGEPWIDDLWNIPGSKMILSLASDLDEARKKIQFLENQFKTLMATLQPRYEIQKKN